MKSQSLTRRQFLKSSALITAAAWAGASAFTLSPQTAVDQVVLGKSGLKASRLGFGAGTHSGRVQRDLGYEGFTRLVHYAYDREITYIDTADGYKTHPYIREAMKGLPREKFFILTKMGGMPENPLAELDRFRRELGTEYVDCVLIHCKIEPDWDESHKRLMDAFAEAKEKGVIRAHGVSCHSLSATAKAAKLDWVDVNLVRVNPQGVKMDTNNDNVFDESSIENVPSVVEQLHVMRQNGHGIIGMKIIGEGDFKSIEDRKKSISFAMQPGLVDAITIGFKSESEIDEAILHMNEALKYHANKEQQ
ncbi:MAG: aldo/keto reductase [Calditrichaeota bacterium]|nr:MAG: aldo/keto reductase [Calditrichota bacterium]